MPKLSANSRKIFTHAFKSDVQLLQCTIATGLPAGVVTMSISICTFESAFSSTIIAKIDVPAETLPVRTRTLFVAAMTIFRMPYALLVGVLIALTALIPIVGAFIGCAVGALLIAIDDPWKALWFIVLFLVLQQIEGNLIYPHVVGSSVGLPSIWVLAAVTLGGKLMGITGMLFFIPLCSVIYALFRSYVKNRLVSKAVPPEKWRDPPPPPSRQ